MSGHHRHQNKLAAPQFALGVRINQTGLGVAVASMQAAAVGAVPPAAVKGENWKAPLYGNPSSILRSTSEIISTGTCGPVFKLCFLCVVAANGALPKLLSYS